MKGFLIFLLLVQGAIGAFGQYLVSPIKKVIPNHNYTVNELREFINSNDPIVGPWCDTFLWLIQDGLTKCGEDLFIVQGHGDPRQTALYMIDNYFIETVRDLPSGFENSGKTLENTIKFVIDKRQIKNMNFLTFKFGSCEKDIVKMNCFNTPNLLERKVHVPKPKPREKEPEREPERANEHRWQDYPYNDNRKEKVQEEIIIVDEESGFYEWQKRNGWWAYSVGSAAVITGVGFIAHDRNHQWYFWFPKSTFVDTGGPKGVPGHEAIPNRPGSSPGVGYNFNNKIIRVGFVIRIR